MDLERGEPLFPESRPLCETFGDDSERRHRWPTLVVGPPAFVGVVARPQHTDASSLPPLASTLLRQQTLVQRDEPRPPEQRRAQTPT
jgi:hypothetical protein